MTPTFPATSRSGSDMPTRPIRFWHGDTLVTLDQVPPTLTVLEWLREGAGCAAVKEGCAEGDCGACTVAVTSLDTEGEPQVRAVNACIQFVATLDGKIVQTAQDIAPAQVLHPVQQAMVDCHGSQCGFCTPGFVMSMYALYEDKRAAGDCAVSRDEAIHTISGNLCRCTGYRPIVDAARGMCKGVWQGPDRGVVRDRLMQLATVEDAVFGLTESVDARFPGHAAGRFFAPRTLASFAALRAEHPASRIVAGSTDVGLWVTKQHKKIGDVLWVGGVAELDTMLDVTDPNAVACWGEGTASIEVGAAVSLSRAWAALRPHFPDCGEYFERFASTPVRNAGTLVGNVANGSPIGDCPPWLIALGASVVLHRAGVERIVALDDFYTGYQKNILQPGEFVRAVRVPLPGADVKVNAWKVSKRYEQDITAVALVSAIQVVDGCVARVRIGVGGMAAVPSRAPLTEAALIGAPVPQSASSAVVQADLPTQVGAAMQALRSEFKPLDDLRASAAYRSEVAANLVLRSWLGLRAVHDVPPALILSELLPVLVEASA